MHVSLAELLLLSVVGLVALVPVVALVFMLNSTVNKTGLMGVNLTPPKQCPRCGHALPLVRLPKNARQALWGGYTCAQCKTELDKWGKVVGE